MEKVCIMGAGSWGTAQALVLNKNGFAITLWGRPGDRAIAAAGKTGIICRVCLYKDQPDQ